MALTKKQRIEQYISSLKQEQSSFLSHWKMLSEFVKPRRGKFEISDHNRGDRRHSSIINNSASHALRVAVAGMFNGTMSPTQPWLMLGTDDPGFLEFGPAKMWFGIVQERMRMLFNKSNLYTMVPAMLDEELLHGTGCLSHEDDPLLLMHFKAHPVGSYVIAQDEKDVVNTLGREFEMTAVQIISKFSPSTREINKNISPAVRTAYDNGNYNTYFPVAQWVAPNDDYQPESYRMEHRPFYGCYYEPGHNDPEAFLQEKGYWEFPFYVPRWELTGEDVYATSSPGMVALGDVRQLQLEEKRKAQGLDYTVFPMLHGPSALSNVQIRNLPGGTTLFDGGGTTDRGLRPVYEVRLPLNEITMDIGKVEFRIERAFFVDLFKAISAMEGVQPRNQLEIIQRHQERLVELGPVLQRQYLDLMNQLVSRTFNQMVRAGLIPDPPRELQGRPLRPHYISPLALAQEAAVTGNMDRLFAFAGGLAQMRPDVLDKLDFDQAIDIYGRVTGTPPELIIPDDDVKRVRAARQQQVANQQMMDMAQAGGNAMKMATDAKLDEDSVGSRMMDQLTKARR